MATYIVLLGPPGAGKGTQSEILAKRLGLPHISSGDIFRENLKNQTSLGKVAKGYIDRGELVPDDITNAMIRERLTRQDCSEGALLDGYPRTAIQAETLDQILADFNEEIELVPYVKVPDEILIERLSGRRTCVDEGHVFHIKFNLPSIPGRCDYDGSDLYQRNDDTEETVKNRLSVYHQQTAPLIEYYRKFEKLAEIDGNQHIQQVTQEIIDKISEEK